MSVLTGAPFGYRYIPKGDGGDQARYEILLEEARVVRQMFDWIGRERVTLSVVRRRLRRASKSGHDPRTHPKRHLLRLVGRALWRDYHQGRPRRATNFGDHRVLRINGVPQIEGPFSQET